MLDKDKKLEPGDCQGNEVDLANLERKLSVEENFISGLLENDPLGGFYKKGLIVFFTLAIGALIWPFDFIFFSPKNGATWIKESNGIEFLIAGKIISGLSIKPLYDKMLSGSGLSLEIWAAPQNTQQTGPARIISYSIDSRRRNFTLGQSEKKLDMRLRTTKTKNNGIYPHIVVEDVFISTKPQHITVTYDFTIQRVYVNGQLRVEKSIPGGNFRKWDPSYCLVLGNEVTADRPWLGKLFYVSIYNCALKPHEIRQNYLVGALRRSGSQKETDLVSAGLVVRYFFYERTGDKIHDSSKNAPHLNLHIPKRLLIRKKHFLSFSFLPSIKIKDIILNIIPFIPLGFLLSGTFQKKHHSLVNTFFIVLILGTLFTISIESVQYFLASRTSSLIDVFNNILGMLLGFVFFGSWMKLLQSKKRGLWRCK